MSVATTYGDISQRTAVYAEGTMLEYIEPIIVLDNFAKVKPLPANTADTMSIRRPVPFPISLTQLQEGVTPAPKKMRYEDLSVTIGQYGDLVEISDRIEDLAEDPVLNDAVEAMSRQIGETKERITWATLIAGTNVFYSSTTASPTSRTQVNDKLGLNLQRQVTKSMKNQRAMKITRKLSAGPDFSTEPVAPSFVAVCHSDCETDIRNLPGFTPAENYASGALLHNWELGKKEDVRYIGSPVLIPWYGAGSTTLNGMTASDGTNVDVYPIVYLSENCFASVPLRGPGSLSPWVENPGKRTKSDPLGQRGYVGWKMYFASLILNEAWIIRAEVGVTDLS